MNRKYAKLLKDDSIEYAPKNKYGISNWGLDENNLKKDGYLPIEEFNNKNVIKFSVKNNKIVPIYADIPEETYADKRKKEYPAIEEQLDMIYWDKINGTNVWQETISAIKTKYPKPSKKPLPLGDIPEAK